jgi:hypothetical protein
MRRQDVNPFIRPNVIHSNPPCLRPKVVVFGAGCVIPVRLPSFPSFLSECVGRGPFAAVHSAEVHSAEVHSAFWVWRNSIVVIRKIEKAGRAKK